MSTKRYLLCLALSVAAVLLAQAAAGAQTNARPSEPRGEGGGAASAIPPPEARLVDSFGAIPNNDMKARLDNFAIDLQNGPGATGVVLAYVDRACRTPQLRGRLEVIGNYLVSARGIDSSRVALTEAGRRRDMYFELWVVPQGGAHPAASPTLSPCPPPRRRRRRP